MKSAAKSIRHVLDLLRKELKNLDVEIARLIADDDDWRGKSELLQSVPALARRPAHLWWQSCPSSES